MSISVPAAEMGRLRSRRSGFASLVALARQKYLGAISAAVILVFLFVAVAGPVIAPYDPIDVDPPGALAAPSPAHWFGTDHLGRDVLSRIIYGTRISLAVGVGAVVVSTVFGILIGLLSAYFGGMVDMVLQRFIDAWQAFPGLLLALAIVATLGPSVINVILAISLSGLAFKARLVRGTALSIMQAQYIDAARAIGASDLRIMALYVLPNCWAPIIVVASITLGAAILTESSLSFLGLGPPPPTPSWGGMLSGSARSYMNTAPWLALAPGLSITIVVLAFNLLGDALRDILDPRLRNTGP